MEASEAALHCEDAAVSDVHYALRDVVLPCATTLLESLTEKRRGARDPAPTRLDPLTA